jgi:hypothetical protein
MIYYYFGEFGFFTDIILGELEHFVLKNPELRGSITIYSYTNNCKVIENLFPSFFIFKNQDYLFPFRVRHDFKDPTCSINDYNGMRRLEELFENVPTEILSTHYYQNVNGVLKIQNDMNNVNKFLGKPLTKKVVITNSKVIELMSKYTNTIIYFFRMRPRVDTYRNFWHTQEIENFLLPFFNNQDTLNVIYMCSDECYYPPFVDYREGSSLPHKNVYECINFEEAVCFFNNCSKFVSNDSGLIDFAKVCGVKEVIILPNYQWKSIWSGYFLTHNFGTNILSVVKQ